MGSIHAFLIFRAFFILITEKYKYIYFNDLGVFYTCRKKSFIRVGFRKNLYFLTKNRK